PRYFRAQTIDILTFLADDNARARGVNRDSRRACRTVDLNPADLRIRQLGANEVADFQVGIQGIAITTAFGIPARCPLGRNAETEPCWMYFVTHSRIRLSVRDTNRQMTRALENSICTATRTWLHALHGRPLVNHDRGHAQLINISTFVVLGIGDSRFEQLADD